MADPSLRRAELNEIVVIKLSLCLIAGIVFLSDVDSASIVCKCSCLQFDRSVAFTGIRLLFFLRAGGGIILLLLIARYVGCEESME